MESNQVVTKKIVANYGELSLKGKNHGDFVKILRANAAHLLSDLPCQVKAFYDHLEVMDFSLENLKEIEYRLQRFIGISNFYFCDVYPLTNDLSSLSPAIFSLLNQKKRYKFEVSRKYKKFSYTSAQIKQILAANVRKNSQLNELRVDVINPEITIYVNVTLSGFEIFTQKHPGINGLPVSSSGKVLMLLSGGIDSSVASHLLMSRGFKVDFLTFVTPPYTSDKNIAKVIALIKQLTLNTRLSFSPRLFVCNFTNLQTEIAHLPKTNYRVIIMRRFFLRLAEMVLDKYNYDALATGDACGQVASQTIQSLKVISDAVQKRTFILRSLVGMNKSWIIDYAKRIGTYDISIIPQVDSCAAFAPKRPITKPRSEVASEIEKNSVLLNDLLWSCFENDIKVISKDELMNYEVGNLYTDPQSCQEV